jgi:thiamine pyrophosphokinase
LRAVIFANGILSYPQEAREAIQPGDLVIAADGGARHCQELGIRPDVLIGDLDSSEAAVVADFESAGTEVIRFPARKDFTDLELAIRHARSLGFQEALVLGGLGGRWDQTLANLLLPAAPDLADMRISLMDGPQEILLLRGGEDPRAPARLELRGGAGDTVSLVPLGGDALGVTTHGLEYPLDEGRLPFGATLGISNVLLAESGSVQVREGILLCIVIHQT